jgi:hypothetical protein
VQYVDAMLGRRDLVGQLPGAVGRAVVHHQDLQALVAREDGRDQAGEVLALVVRRDDDEGALQGFRHRRSECL